MTSRERLLNAFKGLKTDRIPVTLFITDSDIQDGLADCILGEKTGDAIGDLIGFHEILGIDILLRIGINVFEPIAFDQNTRNWHNIWKLQRNSNRLIHSIITPGGELREVFNLEGELISDNYMSEWMKLRNIRIEPLIKTDADLKIIKKYRPIIPDYDFSHITRIKNRLNCRGLVLPRAPSGVFNYAFGLRKLEDLLTDPILRPYFYQELMEFCTEDITMVGKKVASAGGDIVRVVGNIAHGGMVSSNFYHDYITPFEKRYIDALKSQGTRVLFHNCGKCFRLLEEYRNFLDGQALETLSSPLSGGDIISLKEARKLLGSSITIVGNFDQVHVLREGTPSEIQRGVQRIFDRMNNDEKFIFSTSDSLITGTPAENIRILTDTLLDYTNRPYT